MISSLSILIPCFNTPCTELVRQLQHQATGCEGLSFEILVADDGSTDHRVMAANEDIQSMEHCRYIIRKDNIGRAAIRNYLARIARHEWLLFIDSGVEIIHADFLRKYLSQEEPGCVCCGGVTIPRQPLQENLRYLYEKQNEERHTARRRMLQPYRSFRSCNLMIRRGTMERFPFPADMKRYGYEDVRFGRTLAENRISITHIDNPIAYTDFEANDIFLKKTEEAIRNLKEYATELEGYSRLAQMAEKMKRLHVDGCYSSIFRTCRNRWKRQLCGSSPSLRTFALYKLGYYLAL